MNARDAALTALEHMEEEQGRLDENLRALCASLDRRDAALSRKICYGTVQKRALLDKGLRAFVQPERLERTVLNILRLGAYQCWFLERVPRHALVNQAVEQAKRTVPAASGLVNAVLRRLPDTAPESADPCEKHSIAPWLFARLKAQLEPAELLAFLEASDAPAPLTLHTNPLRPPRLPDGALWHPEIPGCYTAHSLEGCGVETGEALVADGGARLCVLAAEPREGERVWDTCAAPGTKSVLMALEMGGRGLVLATELIKHKLPLVREAAKRFSLSNIRTACADTRTAVPDGLYDLALCDVPCSGFGVLRRKPDIRFRSEADCAALPPRQLGILENAAAYVKPGGRLVYCTCTVLREENEAVTGAFLEKHKDFHLEAFTLPLAGHCGGELRLWPQRHGTDGFYICKMRKSL